MVYQGRNIPNTNIINLLQHTLLLHEAHTAEPKGLDFFAKGQAEVGTNKTLIKNKCFWKTSKRRSSTYNARIAD